MSFAKTCSDLQAKVHALEAEKSALTDEHAKALDALKAESVAAVTDLSAKLADAQKSLTEARASLAAKTDEHTAVSASLADLTTRNAAAEKAMAEANAKLENPAFAVAAAAGQDKPVDTGTAAPDSASKTPTWDAFNAIKDPMERTKFWNVNQTKLLDEQKRNAAK